MAIKTKILDTFSNWITNKKVEKTGSEPVIDRAAVGKFLNDLQKTQEGTLALPLQADVIILLQKADIDKITSPETPDNTALTLRTIGGDGLQETGLRSTTVGGLLPYLANDQIQESVRQLNLNPDKVLERYKNIQLQNSGVNTLQESVATGTLNTGTNTPQLPYILTGPELLNPEDPKSGIKYSIAVPDKLLNKDDPNTQETVQVRKVYLGDIQSVLLDKLKEKLFPVEQWEKISQGKSPKLATPQPDIKVANAQVDDGKSSVTNLDTSSAGSSTDTSTTRRTRRRSSADDNNVEA